MQFQIAVKLSVLCYHVANANEKLGELATPILPFVK